jgi:membrane protein
MTKFEMRWALRFKMMYSLLKETFDEWSEDKVPRLGAALAYYSVFSIAPLLIIVIAVAGLIFGKDVAQKDIVAEIEGTVGRPVALAIQDMLVNNSDTGRGATATIIGIVLLLFGAAGVFGQLQDALNTVWKVAPKPGRGIWGMAKDRLLSLSMVLGTGFLLLVSLVVTATLSALSASLSQSLPGGAGFWQIVNLVVSFGIITFLFALIYKYVPDAKIAWHDVGIGATLTAALFSLGKFLLGWYLAQASTTSAFGAAGSLVVVLIWVYYASQILLFGAEFTRVYASRYGSGVKPTDNAMLVTSAALARQGAPRD